MVNSNNSSGILLGVPAQLKFGFLVLLLLMGVFLEGIVHYMYHISVVYTQFYYLIIVVAGLWYGRTVIAISLFFGILEIIVSWILAPNIVPYDAILRALILVIVAIVIWKVVERMKLYHDQVLEQNRELKDMNAQLEITGKAVIAANKKLNLLSSITRHDIRNQLTALLAYIELSRIIVQVPEMTATINKEEIVANNILRQIEFTRTYEDIGVKAPRWNNITQLMAIISPVVESASIQLVLSTGDLEIYADPLLEKVFENLVDNSIRHGKHVQHITVTYERHGTSVALIYRDDGTGIIDSEKEKIFEKGFGKNTGLGLFLTREILSITGLAIRECGTFGEGTCFEIEVSEGCYRFGGKPEPATGSQAL